MPVSHRSARLVAWTNAALARRVSPDLAALEVTGRDPVHRVDGLPGGDDQTLPVVIARWAATVPPGDLRLVLPVPGDVVGLPGPRPFAQAALAAGEAALVVPTYGLVPQVSDEQVRWQAYATALPTPDLPLTNVLEPAATLLTDALPMAAPVTALPSLAEADRALAESLREATDLLTDLDLARWDDDNADALAALRSGRLDGDGLAPGYPDRAVQVLVRARRLRTIVSLAARADSAAVTAGEIEARAAVLRPLDRAARQAEMAAYNSLGEPAAHS